MMTNDLSKQTAEHLMRIEESQDTPVEIPTVDYIPWEDCLSDGMLAVLFNAGVTG